MHTRKIYLIYPPQYKPGDGYKVRRSKLQAWKAAIRLGAGAAVDVNVRKHQGRHTGWVSSASKPLWEVPDVKEQ